MDRLIEVFSNLPWASQIAAWSLRLTTALLVLLLGLWIVRLAANALARLMTRMNVDPMLRDFLSSVLKGVLTVLVLAGALDSLGVPMTSILAALGAAGLAIALALRDSLANLAAGVTLILLKPFRVGDVIEIAGQKGKVEGMRLMHTVLVTPDNCELVLPNSHVASEPITNFTRRDTRRIDLVIGIAYEDDIGKAFSVIDRVLKAESRVLAEPEPMLLVDQLGESSVDLAIRPWVATPDLLATRASLLRQIKEELGAAGIDIPFPQRVLHVVKDTAAQA
ncbi:MAG: mechanosensitive ion channel family protein [Lysobacterales bacterium]|nr:mechanosensitive ion channel family protein [Rhodanobacteraceae bacterium]